MLRYEHRACAVEEQRGVSQPPFHVHMWLALVHGLARKSRPKVGVKVCNRLAEAVHRATELNHPFAAEIHLGRRLQGNVLPDGSVQQRK